MAGEGQVMSMIPMDFSSVLESFSQSVVVTDASGAHVDGVWVEDAPGTTRTVSAIVLAMSFEELQFYAAGDSSAAGITLTTDEELFFTDSNAEGLERRQSYVEYGGYRFRVAGTGFMRKNTLHNIYACVRYFA